jgi:hypothetical protein
MVVDFSVYAALAGEYPLLREGRVFQRAAEVFSHASAMLLAGRLRAERRTGISGPLGMNVGHVGNPTAAVRSCGRTWVMGPRVTMTSASAALAEWNP